MCVGGGFRGERRSVFTRIWVGGQVGDKRLSQPSRCHDNSTGKKCLSGRKSVINARRKKTAQQFLFDCLDYAKRVFPSPPAPSGTQVLISLDLLTGDYPPSASE